MEQTSIYNPQWNNNMEVDKPLYDLMATHGYAPMHTGGGCFSWERCDGAGTVLSIANEGELGSWADIGNAEWSVGRYDFDTETTVDFMGAVTLTQALCLAPLLPPHDPADPDRAWTAADFPTVFPPARAAAPVEPAALDFARGPEMECREALEVAREALERHAAETDTADPEGHRLRLALDVICMMLEQRGCEHFEAGGDGSLASLCNVVIFG